MKLTIIVPFLNEEKTIGVVAEKLLGQPIGPWEKEIIFINDGSKDNSKRIVENLQLEHDIKLICHQKNLGKGAAIKTGIAHATGDAVIIQDADLEYDPADFPRLLQKLADPAVAAV